MAAEAEIVVVAAADAWSDAQRVPWALPTGVQEGDPFHVPSLLRMSCFNEFVPQRYL